MNLFKEIQEFQPLLPGWCTPEKAMALAAAVVALCHPGTDWITGNVINVDGGEEVSG